MFVDRHVAGVPRFSRADHLLDLLQALNDVGTPEQKARDCHTSSQL